MIGDDLRSCSLVHASIRLQRTKRRRLTFIHPVQKRKIASSKNPQILWNIEGQKSSICKIRSHMTDRLLVRRVSMSISTSDLTKIKFDAKLPLPLMSPTADKWLQLINPALRVEIEEILRLLNYNPQRFIMGPRKIWPTKKMHHEYTYAQVDRWRFCLAFMPSEVAIGQERMIVICFSLGDFVA